MLPKTSQRVVRSSSEKANSRVRKQTVSNIMDHAETAQAIEKRLLELEHEWDIERTLEVNGSALALAGLLLGVARGKRWLLLPTAVAGFCLQHALHGWCPPLALFRRLGIRTQREIDEERYALKFLRGDFHGLDKVASSLTLDATRKLLARLRKD